MLKTVMISEAGLNPQSPCLSLPSEGIISTQHHCSPFPYLVFFLLMVWVVLRPCHLDALAVLVNFLFPVLSPGHLCPLSLVTEAHLYQEQSKLAQPPRDEGNTSAGLRPAHLRHGSITVILGPSHAAVGEWPRLTITPHLSGKSALCQQGGDRLPTRMDGQVEEEMMQDGAV
ncbi:hypothetical protein U0070_027382 [Myodes glareolus]|uniref:Uncharacterized protein n=1 Tax=Myodes glareolus TaxID=447135 RepID=A0AAW0J8R1_MYOGA